MDFRSEHCRILRGYSHFKTVYHKGFCSEFSLVLMLVAIDEFVADRVECTGCCGDIRESIRYS